MIRSARRHHIPPLTVHRSPTLSDAIISPFVLDPSSVHLLHQVSANLYTGTWLRTPVSIRDVQSRSRALQVVHDFSKLRHPNLEQFLGAVIDDTSDKLIVFESISGPSLADMLSDSREFRSASPQVSLYRLALGIAVDVSRALLYWHTMTGQGHPCFCPHTVKYDRRRCRAVLQLMGTCSNSAGSRSVSNCLHCVYCPNPLDSHSYRQSSSSSKTSNRHRRRPSKSTDVYVLGRIVVAMVSSSPRGCLESEETAQQQLGTLPTGLSSVLRKCLYEEPRGRPKMSELCHVLTGLHEKKT